MNIVEKGGNYGWNAREATNCFDAEDLDDPPEECPDETPEDVRGGEPLFDPIFEYPHSYEGENLGAAVIGGYVYENDTIPELQDSYLFGDYRKVPGTPSGRLFSAVPPGRA